MAPPGVSAVIMVGSAGDSPPEQLVLAAQRASTLDLIAILQAQELSPIIVAAPTTDWLPPNWDIIRDPDAPDVPFHFGQRLAGLLTRYHLSPTIYFGGGSTPLLDGILVNTIASMLRQSESGTPHSRIPAHVALTNNLHSSDWVGLSHTADALAIIQQAERDNSLAWLLHGSGRFDVRTIAETRMAHHPDLKPHLAQVVTDECLRAIPVREVVGVASTPEANLTLIGRVSPLAWQALNKATQCWTRVFAEERGMVASGRLARYEVRSLLGEMIRQQGPHAFFNALAQMTDAAIIDSRPLMAAQGCWPTDTDRFASDLYLIDAIEDPWLRAFTAAALEAPIPVLLGGHSIVAGGLYALVEIIEQQKTRSR
jgi:hypothetical protein